MRTAPREDGARHLERRGDQEGEHVPVDAENADGLGGVAQRASIERARERGDEEPGQDETSQDGDMARSRGISPRPDSEGVQDPACE